MWMTNIQWLCSCSDVFWAMNMMKPNRFISRLEKQDPLLGLRKGTSCCKYSSHSQILGGEAMARQHFQAVRQYKTWILHSTTGSWLDLSMYDLGHWRSTFISVLEMLLICVRNKKEIQCGSHSLSKGRGLQSLRRVSSAHLAHLTVYGYLLLCRVELSRCHCRRKDWFPEKREDLSPGAEYTGLA